MGKQNNTDAPPSYPGQAHLDAGPVPGQESTPSPAPPSPYNSYGGFNNPSHKPSQQDLDPRAQDPAAYGASPAPPQGYGQAYGQGYNQRYGGPPPQEYYGYAPQQGMQYGPPPPQGGYGPGYGPGYGYPPQQQGYYGNRGLYDQRDDGFCGALLAATACCCCLDACLLF